MYVDVAQAEYGGVCWQQHTNVIACGNYFSLYIFSSPLFFHFSSTSYCCTVLDTIVLLHSAWHSIPINLLFNGEQDKAAAAESWQFTCDRFWGSRWE